MFLLNSNPSERYLRAMSDALKIPTDELFRWFRNERNELYQSIKPFLAKGYRKH